MERLSFRLQYQCAISTPSTSSSVKQKVEDCLREPTRLERGPSGTRQLTSLAYAGDSPPPHASYTTPRDTTGCPCREGECRESRPAHKRRTASQVLAWNNDSRELHEVFGGCSGESIRARSGAQGKAAKRFYHASEIWMIVSTRVATGLTPGPRMTTPHSMEKSRDQRVMFDDPT